VEAGTRVCGLVLAAGASLRAGPVDKLLVTVEGESMVRRVARVALGAGLEPVVVVTPSPPGPIGGALDGLPVRLAENPDARRGLSTSLRRGLSEIPEGSLGVAVLLADMPFVRPDTVCALVAALEDSDGWSPCVPVYGGRWGNPVVWPARYLREMRALEGARGARGLLELHADRVREVVVDDEGIHRDVDTPADVAALQRAAPPPTRSSSGSTPMR
jgi:molybdenum cofactor cytidylyltransferase